MTQRLCLNLWIVLLAALYAALPAVAAEAAGKSAQGRPNILFIFCDDHAYQALSAYGHGLNKTPNLDRIASEGMLFENCFVTNSLCGPSRAVVQTGKYSHLNGYYGNSGIEKFDGSQQTMPKLMQAAGYQTAVVGKWHLVSDPQGYDYWHILPGQGIYYNPPMIENGKQVRHQGYVTDIITDITLDWLKNQRDPNKPFLMMYQHKAPHREWDPDLQDLHLYDDTRIPEPDTLYDDYSGRATPARNQDMTIDKTMRMKQDLKVDWVPPSMTPQQKEKWLAAYGPKNEAFKKMNLSGSELVSWKFQRYMKDYLRCVHSVDRGVGRVLDYLDAAGLADNTIVIYSSDQGFYLGEHGWFDKRWIYEESLRTPLLVRWPGVVKPGSRSDAFVSNLDFAETILDAAGVKVPDDMQGRSFVPILKGNTPADWRDAFYYHYYEYQPGPHDVPPHYGVRTRDFMLARFPMTDEWELFDMKKDPKQLKSVYNDPAYAATVKQLTAKLRDLQKQYGDTNPDITYAEILQQIRKRNAPKVKPTSLKSVLQRDGIDQPAPKDVDPSAKPFTVGATCTPTGPDGVIVAQGGGAHGYSLYLQGGVPHFVIRSSGDLVGVTGPDRVAMNKPVNLVGVLDAKTRLHLYVDGQPVATAAGAAVVSKPADGLSLGQDSGDPVGEYESPLPFAGKISDLRIYYGAIDQKTLNQWAKK